MHTCERLAGLYNGTAMALIEGSKHGPAKDLLDRAEVMTRASGILARHGRDACLRLRAATLNNLGCYHRYRERHADALAALIEALDIEEAYPAAAQDTASTLLNLCTVCSRLGDHHAALQYAKHAAMEIESGLPIRPPKANAVSPTLEDWLAALREECGGELPAAVGNLAVAHHNAAVEMEHCGMTRHALTAYRQCLAVSAHANGAEGPMHAAFEGSYAAFRKRHFPGYDRASRPGGGPRAAPGRKGPRTTGALMVAATQRLDRRPHTVQGNRDAKEAAEFHLYMAAALRGEASGLAKSTAGGGGAGARGGSRGGSRSRQGLLGGNPYRGGAAGQDRSRLQSRAGASRQGEGPL